MKKKLYWQLPFLIFLIVGTVFIVRQQRSTPYQHDEGQVFGTFYHITYQNDSSLNNDILAELDKVDNALSMFNDKSIISRVNRGENVETNDMFNAVFNLAEQIADNTNGSFDITVAPLVNTWGFGFKTGNPPSKMTIDSLRSIVGYKKVSLHNNRITKTDPRVMLDCSAIAKGYGCDVVARLLQRHGIENYMVEIGGEVVTHGISEKRLPWKIGVTKPTDDSLAVDKELQTVLNVKNMARLQVATTATSTIRMVKSMPIPSTLKLAIPFSIISCLPLYLPSIAPRPTLMPHRLWLWDWMGLRRCSKNIPSLWHT